MAIRVVIAAEPYLVNDLVRALPAGEFYVASTLTSADQLLTRCRELKPQLVLLQLSLAKSDSLVCVEDVMAFAPTPILMIAGPGEEPANAFSALAAGALDAVAFEADGRPDELVHRARLLAGVRVITHVRAKRERPTKPQGQPPGFKVVAIGASLGGPRAISQLLTDLKPPINAPVLIVQHISDGFSEGLAHWLSSEVHHPVREAHDGQLLVPGMIAVAPSRQHLEVREGSIRLTDAPPEGGFRPSCTTLFRSVARWYGPRGIGVVLTGMGSDGAEGLLSLRRQGGRTLAQDEQSCVVYGMPKAARDLGAVEQTLPLEHIAAALRRILDG
jgi:two-component system chemotaxis response regulator CheB